MDDFLFIKIMKALCNQLIDAFLRMCKDLRILVAIEKTEWASNMIIFLGILLHSGELMLSLPIEKQEKVLRLLKDMCNRKKATIKQLQVLTGYLSFLTKAIPAGHTFMRRMYAKCLSYEITKTGQKLLQHHHVSLDGEFKFDCTIWKLFLEHHHSSAVCCPMIDFETNFSTARELRFTSDASKNVSLGFGATFQDKWLFGK